VTASRPPAGDAMSQHPRGIACLTSTEIGIVAGRKPGKSLQLDNLFHFNYSRSMRSASTGMTRSRSATAGGTGAPSKLDPGKGAY
jgi:hypothetical protein